jgi:hypothetical protein
MTVMRNLAFALVAGWLAAGFAAAADEEPTAADKALIRQVIQDQVAAFQRDDGEAAFGFAAPSIRAMFGSPEHFMAMVRTGYRPVYRPRELLFRDLMVEDSEVVQPVTVVGPDGVPVIALYKMEWQAAERVWRIKGCVLLPSPDKTA